jgi:hypothetical protein
MHHLRDMVLASGVNLQEIVNPAALNALNDNV